MRRASLNHVFRLKWSDRAGALIAVPESRTARGKRASAVFGAVACLLIAATRSHAGALPTGGVVTSGSGTISQSGNTLTVNQTSSKLVTQWSSFNIAPGDVVKYVQPSSSSVALNRVLGSDPSVIQGALIANGQVFLLNPNGVLFSRTAQVNVGGLVASTLSLSDDDFLRGEYRFSASKEGGTVTNQGSLVARDGGTIALIAAKVVNSGSLSADRGNVLLGSGDQVVLDVGAPVKLKIAKGALDALVDNGGAIRADGGVVLLTAKATNELMTRVINNTGTIEARTLATGQKGEILLLGGMEDNSITVGGTLDASAPLAADGGHIETSAAAVETLDGLAVKAGAVAGKGGDWLVDPYNYTINSTAAANITSALNQGTSVSVTTQTSNTNYGGSGTTGTGDITVSSAIAKTSGGAATLSLQADHNIYVNSPITSTSGALGITLSAANASGATSGGVSVAANLSSNGGRILIGGGTGTSSHGIGYARNATSSTPAVSIGTSVSIQAGGGDVTINGSSTGTTSSYSGTAGGIYILSGASLNTGGGNLFMSGISQSAAKEFGFSVEANSNTVTTFMTSGSTGSILLDAQNLVSVDGALGLVSNGNQARVQFIAPSVAQIQVSLNGSLQNTTFGYSPPCNTGFPNCGTMTIPGSNGSYLSADYQAVSMATNALWVETGDGSKSYDGSTNATGLTLTTLNAPVDFSTAGLTFSTASRNAGTYTSLVNSVGDPTSFSSSNGNTYAIGYNYGTYSISPRALTVTATNKPYDGSTTASLSASGVISGDAVSFSGTGGFAAANVGNNISVNVTGIALSGADAANYTVGSGSLSTTANITPRVISLAGSRVYNNATDANASIFSLSNLVSGESLTLSGAGSFANKTVGSGKTVSVGTLALGNGTNGLASNYTLVGGTDTASITAATLTISGLTAQNKVYDATTAATLTGTASLAGLLSGDSVNLVGSAGGGAFANKNVGSGKGVTANLGGLSLSGADAGNYVIGSVTTPLTANITPAALTVSGLAAQGKVYDATTAATLSGTPTLTGLYSGDSVSLGGTASQGTFVDKNVGNAKGVAANLTGLTLSGADVGNYQLGSVTTPLAANITPATLTISGLSAQDKVYDATATAAVTGTASLSGLYMGDSVSLGGSATAGTFASKNVGTGKTVSANLSGLSLSGADSSNYQIGTVTTPLAANITRATLTVSGLSAQNKVYDATTAATLTGTASLSGVYGGDTVNFSGTASGTFADKDVATGKAVTANLNSFTLSGADGGNYQVGSVTTPLAANITPATLTVSGLSAQSRVYDATNAATLTGTATLAGLFSGDSVGLNGAASSGTFADKDVGVGKAVTANLSGLSLSGADAGDYQLGPVTTPLTANITRATLALSGLTAQSKVYDSTTVATISGTPGLVGTYSGDSVSLSGTATSGSFADKDAGVGKSVSVNVGSLSLAGSDAGNYQIGSVTTPLTAGITPATLTISGLSAQNKVYDATSAANLGGSPTLAGLYGGDSVGLTGTAAAGAFANKNVGSGKIVTADLSGLALSGSNAADYVIGGVTTPLLGNVTPATLTISGLSAQNKVYDATTTATLIGTASVSGTYGGDTVNLAGTATAGTFADKNVGTAKSVAANLAGLTLSGADAANYQIGSVTAPLSANISPANLTISGLSAQNKVYDGTTAAILTGIASLSGVYSGDTVGFSGTALGAFANKNVGSGKTVTADISSFLLSGADSGNYQIASVTSPLAADVTPASATVSGLSAQNKIYDATTAATLSGTPTLTGIYSGDSVGINGTATTGAFADKNVGIAKAVSANLSGLSLAGSDASNYQIGSLTAPLAANITPAVLTVSGLSAQDKVYDATVAATLTGAPGLNGLFSGDSVDVSGTANAGTFADKNAGAGKAVSANLSGLTLSGADSGNYQVGSVTAPLAASITPAILTVSGLSAQDKVYDATTAATLTGAPGLNGIRGGDSVGVSGTVSSGTFADKNAGTGKAVSANLSGLTLSGADSGNYQVGSVTAPLAANITPATLTYIATPVTITAGLAAPPLRGEVTGFVGGEGVATATSGALTFTMSTTGSTAGNYPILGGGLAADHGNYVFTQSPANAQALTVTGSNAPTYFTNITVTQPAFATTAISGIATPTAPAISSGQKVGGLNYVYVSSTTPDSNSSVLATPSLSPDHATNKPTTTDSTTVLAGAPDIQGTSAYTTDTQQAQGNTESTPSKEHTLRTARVLRPAGIVDVVVVDGGINVHGLDSPAE